MLTDLEKADITMCYQLFKMDLEELKAATERINGRTEEFLNSKLNHEQKAGYQRNAAIFSTILSLREASEKAAKKSP